MDQISQISKKEPIVKDVLVLLSVGVLLTASIVMPGIGMAVAEVVKRKRRKKHANEWDSFKQWRLKQLIRRLAQQQVVTIENGVIVISEKGRRRLLKYTLETISLQKKSDGYWRLISYDVAVLKNEQRAIFRELLKKLECIRLQQSVYLTPYACDDEIAYIKHALNLSHEVVVLKVKLNETRTSPALLFNT